MFRTSAYIVTAQYGNHLREAPFTSQDQRKEKVCRVVIVVAFWRRKKPLSLFLSGSLPRDNVTGFANAARIHKTSQPNFFLAARPNFLAGDGVFFFLFDVRD